MTELTPVHLAHWRDDAERFETIPYAQSEKRRILALIDALEAERARVEQVRALAEEWASQAEEACGDSAHYGSGGCADCAGAWVAAALRDALDDTAERVRADLAAMKEKTK